MPLPLTDWLDWTVAEYEVGAPATSLSFERWFRNPVALAQGAPGAPRVEFAAMAASHSDADGLGSYVFATSTTNCAYGALRAGSTLQPTSAARTVGVTGFNAVSASLPTGSALTGTWRCMGTYTHSVSANDKTLDGATLWKKVLA